MILKKKTQWDHFAVAAARERKKRLRPEPYMLAGHICTAVTQTNIDYYIEHPEDFIKTFAGMPASSLKPIVNGFVEGINLNFWLQDQITQGAGLMDMAKIQPLERVGTDAATALTIQLAALLREFPDADLALFTDLNRLLIRDPRVVSAYRVKQFILSFKAALDLQLETREYTVSVTMLPHWRFNGNLVVLDNFPNGGLIILYPMLLNMLDKKEAEFPFWVYLIGSSHSSLRKNTGMLELNLALRKIVEECLLKCGNIGYRVLKGLSTIVLGFGLAHDELGIHDKSYYPEQLKALLDEDEMLVPYINRIVALYEDHWASPYDDNLPTILETYGQEKAYGLPIVDPEMGLAKMCSYGRMLVPKDPQFINEVLGVLKAEYVSNYYSIEGRVPKVHLQPSDAPGIIKMFAQNEIPSLNECLKLDLGDWGRLTIGKDHEFSHYPDPLDLLDDKGVCPPGEQYTCVYARDPRVRAGLPSAQGEVVRRLLTCILNVEELDIEAWFKECNDLGYVPQEWCNALLLEKEGELKEVPRMFTILTFQVRMLLSVLEHNIKKDLFRYFPSQYVTNSGLTVRRRITEFTQQKDPEGGTYMTIVLDMEQWNLTERPEMMGPMYRFYDSVFGTDYYWIVSAVFKQLRNFSANAFLPPGLQGHFTDFYDHGGGCQGLGQNGWTLPTQACIKRTMQTFGYKYQLLGSGDNQLISFLVPKGEDPVEACERVKALLAINFRKMGLLLRADETYYSDSLIVFQRNFHYNARTAANATKQVQKSVAGGSDSGSCTMGLVANSMNVGQNMAALTHDPVVAPYFAFVEGFTTMAGTPHLAPHYPKTSEAAAVLAMLNTDLGGYPFTSLTGFFISGINDHLTVVLSMLKRVWEMRPDLRALIASYTQLTRGQDTDEARSQMMQDPTTINLWKPPQAEAVIRSAVEDYLRKPGIVRNKILLERFNLVSKELIAQMSRGLLCIRCRHHQCCNWSLQSQFNHCQADSIQPAGKRRTFLHC